MEGRGGWCAASREGRAVSGEAASVVSSGAVFNRQALLLALRALDSHMLSRQRRHRRLSARPPRSLGSWTPPTPGGRQAGWGWTVWSRHRSRASARTPFAPLESEPSRVGPHSPGVVTRCFR
jgi:hypothetical protein